MVIYRTVTKNSTTGKQTLKHKRSITLVFVHSKVGFYGNHIKFNLKTTTRLLNKLNGKIWHQ